MVLLARRTFLVRAAQTALGAVGLLAGCSGPAAPTATPPASPPVANAPKAPTRAPEATATPAATRAASAASAPTAAPQASATATASPPPDLAVVRGASPAAITRAAVEVLGGIGRFVRPGQRVLVKPNICIAQPPEYAATTNPEVVGTLVSLCREAGAARVLVLDGPFAGINSAYKTSGIEAAVKAAGGEMEMMSRLKYRQTPIPKGKDLKSWPVYEDALTYDVLINVPIAKTHDVATLTLGMKNLMGLVDNRGAFHSNIGQCLADLSSLIKPTLIVVDAVRILTRNGPTGGNLADVKATNTVIAGTDPVAADAYGATLFGKKGDDLAYVQAGAAMGLGSKDLTQLRIGERQL